LPGGNFNVDKQDFFAFGALAGGDDFVGACALLVFDLTQVFVFSGIEVFAVSDG